MKISEMVISNFRLFRHDQVFNFGTEDGKPLTIVRAENRTGKTTLLTAIQWCFYGNAALANAKQTLSGGDLLVSADALKEANPGDVVKTEVTIRFESEGRDYIAKRVRETQRGTSENESTSAGPDTFTVLREDATGSNVLPNPQVFVGQLLPENLRELFLFDGDRINRFMEADHADAVQRAVSDMLEFELFDDAQRHLKAILSDYRSQLRGSATGEVKQLRDEQARMDEELEKVGDELVGLESEFRASEILEEELTTELANDPGDAGPMQQHINELKDQIRSQESASGTLSQDLGRQIGQGTFFSITGLELKARDLLRDKKEAGEIPRRIGEDLINERLELGVCICGRPLDEGDEAHEHLKKQLEQQKDRAVFDEMATEVYFHLNSSARKDNAVLSQRLNDILAQRTNYATTVIALSKQVGELEKQLDGIDAEAITRKRAALTDTRRRTQSFVIGISEQKQKASAIQRELDDVLRKLRQAERRDERNRVLRKREELAEDCLKALTLTYQNVREIEREKISAHTQEIFFRMNLRKDEFEKVEVTPSFRLQVIATGGYVANSVLSGAQRRALSLAFLFALMKVSERDAPVVVDTPLGMTSGPMRRSITEAMLDQTEQLVLLLTRSEIQGVEDILQRGAARQMTLTCSRDYPMEIVNPPRSAGAYTEVCECGINTQCSICERKPSIEVSEQTVTSDVQGS